MDFELSFLFLEALKAGLDDNKVYWDKNITSSQWLEMFKKASDQHLLPILYESVRTCHSFQKTGQEVTKVYKPIVIQSVLTQTVKTTEFLNLYQYLLSNDLQPVVVKGLICRNLYPQPDQRISNDEDILINPDDFMKYHNLLLKYGMKLTNENQNINEDYEVSYYMPNTTLCIELHKYLFPTDSQVYDQYNTFFKGAYQRAIKENVNEVMVATLEYTDHLLYLICHALKHFVHSGVGIRQVCDIVIYANTYGSKINWNKLIESCQKIKAIDFMVSVFDIGKRYLNFSDEKSLYPEYLKSKDVDSFDMLNDILSGGVYGATDDTRLHSGTITRNALENSHSNENKDLLLKYSSLFKTLFPSKDYMQREFAYLNKHSYLLPLAWFQRIYRYLKKNQDYKHSLKLADARLELLKKYKIIK